MVAMNGKKIKAIRKRLGDSREKFGKRLGVSRFAVYRWEEGSRTPSGAAMFSLKLLEDGMRKARETAA
jgi:DNA-binding transcriptional regulator YiaG